MKNQTNRHIIKKQILEFEIEDKNQTQFIQSELSQIFNKKLLPIINKELDKVSRSNSIQRIDRLEINLGEINLKFLEAGMESKFESVFPQMIQRVLKRQVNNQFSKTDDEGRMSSSLQKNSKLPNQKKDHPSSLELLQHFIEKGRLPWWVDLDSPKIIEQSLNEIIENVDRRVLERIFFKYLKNDATRKRIVVNFDWSQLTQIIILFIDNHPNATSYFEEWNNLLGELVISMKSNRSQLNYWFWDTIFSTVVLSGVNKDWEEHLVENVLFQFSSKSDISYKEMENHINHLSRENIFKKRKRKQPIEKKSKDIIQERKILNKKNISFSESEEIYIQNAGLVILWIFYKRFFEHLGWIEEGKFKNEQFQFRAIVLLQYMASGESKFEEYHFPLNKLLCGIRPDDPMEPQEPIMQEEKDACDALIEAAINHGAILGSISKEGFRNTFLMREGILKRKENYWLLQVQKETFDIVLEKVPWNFNMVKLPWMSSAIYVEW